MKNYISWLVTAFCPLLFGIVQIQARDVSETNRDAMLRRVEALQNQIAMLERAIPNLETTVDGNTNNVNDLQRRTLASACALKKTDATSCILSSPLQVAGPVSVVGPAVRVGSLNVVGALNVEGNLGVNGTLTHRGSLTSVAGNVNVNLEATINDDMAVIGNLDVTNNMIFWGNLDVVGSDSTTTFTNDLHVQTDAIFSGSATMLGDVTVDGPFAGPPPQGTGPGSTNYELEIKSEYIDIKKKSYWEGAVSVKVHNQYQDMRVDDLIIGAGLCGGSSVCNFNSGP